MELIGFYYGNNKLGSFNYEKIGRFSDTEINFNISEKSSIDSTGTTSQTEKYESFIFYPCVLYFLFGFGVK